MSNNSVVLITGGLTGIGRAAAVAFAKKGAKVVVAGRRDEVGQALAKELRSLGSEAEFINADVRKDEDVRALVDKTVARFGRLDVAVNNAGTEGQVGPITDQTAESYAATFDTNVLGVILSMKHEVRAMQGQGSGAIINISSTYGHEGAAGASVYVGSKHAVEGITKSVALEIAKSGIRVNAVAPGPTDTGMLTRFTGTPENKAALTRTVPMERLGLSEELANAIVFIASDEASFITGHVLNVDGGESHGPCPVADPRGEQRKGERRRNEAEPQWPNFAPPVLGRAGVWDHRRRRIPQPGGIQRWIAEKGSAS
jgi:NAD(P)-dependent dehydrogenase (short-subunit alcohol dehydrogenase family)